MSQYSESCRIKFRAQANGRSTKKATIDDALVKEAVMSVEHIPEWRDQIAELMYCHKEHVWRITHLSIRDAAERTAFINACNQLLLL
jgi:hypothetical protein